MAESKGEMGEKSTVAKKRVEMSGEGSVVLKREEF